MTTPAGWYLDPGVRGQRYYDGNTWTEQYAQAYTSAPPPVQRRTHPIVWVLVGLGLVPVLLFGGCAALGASGISNDDAGSSSTSAESVPSGTYVSDGKVDFVVSQVGQPGPRGVYIIAHMMGTNTGSKPLERKPISVMATSALQSPRSAVRTGQRLRQTLRPRQCGRSQRERDGWCLQFRPKR